MRIQGQRVTQPLDPHELEADAIHEAQSAPILVDQPFHTATMERFRDPLDREDRDDGFVEITHRRETDPVLQEGDRLDQDV